MAAGIGITPLLSHAHAAVRWGRSFTLLYRHAGGAHLDELPALCGERLPSLTTREACAENLARALVSQPLGAHLYVCGPAPFTADALEAQGFAVPYRCRRGVCGECLLPVTAGRPEHRDLYLSAAERSAGDCLLPCVFLSLRGAGGLAVTAVLPEHIGRFPFPFGDDTYRYSVNVEPARTFAPTAAGGWGGCVVGDQRRGTGHSEPEAAVLPGAGR